MTGFQVYVQGNHAITGGDLLNIVYGQLVRQLTDHLEGEGFVRRYTLILFANSLESRTENHKSCRQGRKIKTSMAPSDYPSQRRYALCSSYLTRLERFRHAAGSEDFRPCVHSWVAIVRAATAEISVVCFPPVDGEVCQGGCVN